MKLFLLLSFLALAQSQPGSKKSSKKGFITSSTITLTSATMTSATMTSTTMTNTSLINKQSYSDLNKNKKSNLNIIIAVTSFASITITIISIFILFRKKNRPMIMNEFDNHEIYDINTAEFYRKSISPTSLNIVEYSTIDENLHEIIDNEYEIPVIIHGLSNENYNLNNQAQYDIAQSDNI